MSVILSFTLASFATITGIMAINAGRKGGLSDALSRHFVALAVSSSIWSVCFGAILIQEDPEVAYLLRCLGMIGTFACLISAVVLITRWAKVGKKMRRFLIGISLLGNVIYPFNIRRDYIEFKLADVGMSYSFKPNIWTDLYMIYSIAIAVSLFAVVIWMRKSTKKRRMKVMATRLLLSLVVISAGMLFDTILPAFGILAVPTSSLAQAICVFMVYTSLNFNKKNRIYAANIAEYIDNSIEIYVLAYDEELRVTLASNSAMKFMNLNPAQSYSIVDLFNLDEECYKLTVDSARYDAECVLNNTQCNIGIEVIRDDFEDIIGYVVSITDMTEKMEYIREIEQAKKDADEANKAKSIFLANMSHEIRTPLNAVIGMDEMIMREHDIDEIHKYAKNIKDAGKSLLAIIDDVLDFSKIESGMMHIVEGDYDFHKELRELYSIVIFRARKKGLQLIFEVDSNIPKILHGDEVRVRQILVNIINNAVKYTEVGWVKVKADSQWIDDENIMLTFSVEDTGIGIKKEDMPKLFEKFRRLDENINHRVEGTGLGLSIVYSLVTMMGGTVEVKSVYQRGSIFTVSIPQRVANKEPIGGFDVDYTEDVVQYKESFKAPNAKVLVVDDNQINLSIVRGLLKHTEVKVDIASGGLECIEMVKKEKYDIILLDHMMPEMDGVEVLNCINAMEDCKSKGVPVIALTANAIVGAKEQYLSYGFSDYISKPIDSMVLEDTVRKYLSEELIQIV